MDRSAAPALASALPTMRVGRQAGGGGWIRCPRWREWQRWADPPPSPLRVPAAGASTASDLRSEGGGQAAGEDGDNVSSWNGGPNAEAGAI
uniref:DUF834 domain-containing protein n=1 Tax=Oryza punctata TaxID=4537 RepID=A0A0E0KPB6_ORYPU